jgi:hypothetical protein
MKESSADKIEAWVPIGMALVALAAIAKAAINFQRFGPPTAEDGPWHLFMLAMVVQLGGIFCLAFMHRHRFVEAAPVLTAQIGLFGVWLRLTSSRVFTKVLCN